MKIIKYFIFLVVTVVVLIAVGGIFLPSSTEVERSIFIEQQPDTVFDQINTMKNFNAWSPWYKKDPSMRVRLSGAESGVGAKVSWSSQNPSIGEGSQTILSSTPHKNVTTLLQLGAVGTAEASINITPNDTGSFVNWGFTAQHEFNLVSRYIGLAMDHLVGADFEEGLRLLKAQAESLPAAKFAVEPVLTAGEGAGAGAEILEQVIRYELDGVALTGFLAMPAAGVELPGVIVVHEWWGHNDYVRNRAIMLAKLGYAAFALDMYGDGKVTTHPKEANAFMMETRAKAGLAQARFQKALEEFTTVARVNPLKIAAIGYCFGGAIVLNEGRSGTPLVGVASFHGSLGRLVPLTPRGAALPYLVLNGAADPMISEADKTAFKDDMNMAKVNYEFVDYPDAMHAFTNPGATEKGEAYGLPLAYNQAADEHSWQKLTVFLSKVFN